MATAADEEAEGMRTYGACVSARQRVARVAQYAVLAAALALVAPASALAHVPTLEPRAPSSAETTPGSDSGSFPADRALSVEGPDESRAIYGYLAPGQRYDAYTFEVAATVTTTIELLVPVRKAAEGFRPSLHLIAGAGGARLDASDPGLAERPRFFEPFSLQSFWKGATIEDVVLEPGVRYDLIVEPGMSDVRSGPYVIGFSGAERFTPADWASTFRVLPTIWLGTYGGAPARTGASAACAAAGLLLVGVAVLVVRRRARRRSIPPAT